MTNFTTNPWWVTHKITRRGQEQYVMVVDGEVWAWRSQVWNASKGIVLCGHRCDAARNKQSGRSSPPPDRINPTSANFHGDEPYATYPNYDPVHP